jgi:hypothetical protein
VLASRRIGGAHRPVTSQLTHIDPPKAWGVGGIDGPIRATADLAVEPLIETRDRLPRPDNPNRSLRKCRGGSRCDVSKHQKPASCGLVGNSGHNGRQQVISTTFEPLNLSSTDGSPPMPRHRLGGRSRHQPSSGA